MKIGPYGSLRSHGRSLRSLPVQTVHSLPLPIPPSYTLYPLHIPFLSLSPPPIPCAPCTFPSSPSPHSPIGPSGPPAGRAGSGRQKLRGPVAGSLVDPVRDSLGSLGGGQRRPIFIQFLANLGPLWAHNPPNRGYGWLPLVFLCIFGTTNVHFGAKNPIFRPFSLIF